MEYMIMPLKRYFDFSGRSRRMEYWMFFLFTMIVFGVLGTVMIAGLGADETGLFSGAAGLLFMIVAAALFIPSLAVQVRRFHDQDKSGWMVLLAFVPFVGGLIVLIFMLLEGTHGPNSYGPDPKGRDSTDIGDYGSETSGVSYR
ncbi:DUF805 domain-containing protein [Qipengyuania sp. 1NDH17]|uniref:DUF805 domain-containing protein n=1 Tax=Qipengyuania polymorpha TaxID=2867234 RepID=A0ABS7IWH1_9SPHN|nr:DUF805 domain-containing protein [Qipengyuania polymorpha]MBX7457880.1 DUF805 domain-containing protein [Qipengyuania polymorpha]